MMPHTFLYRVYQRDKALFAIFILFITGQLFFTYKRIENTPFFHYGMYAAHCSPRSSYTVYNIAVDTNRIRSLDFPDYQREVVYNTIAAYDGLQQSHFTDTLDKVITKRFAGPIADGLRRSLLNNKGMDTPYQKWLFSYIADMRLVKNPVIEVKKQQVSYHQDGTQTTNDSVVILFKLRYE